MSALLEGSPLRKRMNVGTGVTHAKSFDHRSLKPCHNHSALSVLRENGHFSGSEDTGEQSPFRARECHRQGLDLESAAVGYGFRI